MARRKEIFIGHAERVVGGVTLIGKAYALDYIYSDDVLLKWFKSEKNGIVKTTAIKTENISLDYSLCDESLIITSW
jgi:hypothetical protein